MTKLRMLVVVAIVLSLLVASSLPVAAGKPNPPAEKPKDVPKGHAGEKNPDKQGPANPKGPKPPKSIPEPGGPAPVRVTLCHKPGTPAQQTLVVAAPAVPAHLRHGDRLGPCTDLSATPPITPTATITLTVTPEITPTIMMTVTLCHKPGTPAEKTLVLPMPALHGHLRHGDTLGPCPTLTPTPTITPTVTITPTATVTPTTAPASTLRILICHKPGTPAEKTMALPPDAIPDHLVHFDTLGACGAPASVTWATDLVATVLRWLMALIA
jgi:hypothetical protein